MKKFISVFIALATVLSLTVFARAELIGDVNSDGSLNSSDALAILQYSVGKKPENFNVLVADLNTDGAVNSIDALAVLQIVVGIIPDPNLPAEPDDPTKYSKAQIVAYYNKAIRDTAKSAKVTADKTDLVAIVIDSMEPDNNALKQIINENILSKYAKPTTSSYTFTNGKASDGTTATDFLPKSKLEPAGVKSAKVEKSGSNYVVTIVTVAEKTTLENPDAKYTGQCAAPIDFASIDLGPIKIVQADMNYPGVTIKATVNANGKLVTSSFDQPINGTCAASVSGLNVSATVHGSLNRNIKYTY